MFTQKLHDRTDVHILALTPRCTQPETHRCHVCTPGLLPPLSTETGPGGLLHLLNSTNPSCICPTTTVHGIMFLQSFRNATPQEPARVCPLAGEPCSQGAAPARAWFSPIKPHCQYTVAVVQRPRPCSGPRGDIEPLWMPRVQDPGAPSRWKHAPTPDIVLWPVQLHSGN